MTAFAVRRLVRFVVSLAVLLVAAFAMIHLVPGDPVRAALGPTAPARLVAARRAELGLDRPILVQLGDYLWNVVRGRLGASFVSRDSVAGIIAARLPSTLELAALSMAAAVAVAVPLGMWTAVRTEHGRGRGTDLAFTSATGAVAAIPEFLLAVGMVILFALVLKWLPPAGKAGPSSFVMPVAALAAGPAAVLARLLRVEALRELGKDYMLMARAKRLPPARLYFLHLLPNALTATLTVGGLLLSGLVAGTVIVESVFAWPGMGTELVQSIIQKDYPVAQAMILVYGGIVLLVNLLVDFALGALDPRSTIRTT